MISKIRDIQTGWLTSVEFSTKSIYESDFKVRNANKIHISTHQSYNAHAQRRARKPTKPNEKISKSNSNAVKLDKNWFGLAFRRNSIFLHFNFSPCIVFTNSIQILSQSADVVFALQIDESERARAHKSHNLTSEWR